MSEELFPEVLTSSTMENDPAVQASVGRQLRAAREARGISIGEAAAAMKLSPRQVTALEVDNWQRLPRTVIRGFIRNYARCLGQNAAPFLAILDSLPLPDSPELEVKVGAPVAMPKESRTSRRDYLWFVSGLVVLVFAVLVYYLLPVGWWQSKLELLQNFTQTKVGDKTAVDVTPPLAVIPLTNTSSAEMPSPVSSASREMPPAPIPGVEQAKPVSSAVDSALVASGQSPIPPGQARVIFSFTQSSWVEVRDRNGQIVFSQLSPAGSQREITGAPPLSLVVGNASHVTVHYKDKPVDLSKRSKEDVARLTLE